MPEKATTPACVAVAAGVWYNVERKENTMESAGTIWTAKRINAVAKKYGVDCVYICYKNGCDALAVETEGRFIVLPKSRVAPADAAFNANVNSIQDMRRVAENFGRIKNGELNSIRGFSTLSRAAQFVRAKHNARKSDWLKVQVDQ